MDYSQIYHKVAQRTREDPIKLGMHNGRYKFYYKKQVAVELIDPLYTVDQMIEWANADFDLYGVHAAFDQKPSYDIAQFAKVNAMYHSLKEHGNIKPFWLQQRGDRYEVVTGGSRRRALTFIPEMPTVSAILCLDADTKVDDSFKKIESFVDLCNIVDEIAGGTHTWFKVADPSTNYGIDWFEMATDSVSNTVGEDFRSSCINNIRNFIAEQDNSFRFDYSWFMQQHWE